MRPVSRPSGGRRREARGFTLLEIVVVMALLSLVMLGLGASLRSFASTETRIDARLERMQEQRFPRALELKAKVDAGETLEDFDIDFLEKVFEDCTSLKPLLDRHPQYQELAARMMSLYHAITTQALANEQASSPE